MDEGRFSRIETSLFFVLIILTGALSVWSILFFARALQLLAFLLRGQ